MSSENLSTQEKNLLFWASFLSLAAAGVGFVFRVAIPDLWATEFKITGEEVGALTGAALWPIAVTMILFSFLVDKIGYKPSMMIAVALQALSAVLTFLAKDTGLLLAACLCAGLGHGVVEACINPLCASIYRDQKTKMLNILHAAWPAGIVFGGLIWLTIGSGLSWRANFLFILLPVIAYAVMFLMCKRFPVDERVDSNVSTRDMLREFGGLGAFLAGTFLFYELSAQFIGFAGISAEGFMANRLVISIAVGIAIGFMFGYAVKALGQILFFILCLLMIPLATAELATDGWIQSLMRPVLANDFNIDAMWAIVASAFIMMVLRFFAGIPLKFVSPPALLVVSAAFSIAGLYMLSGATGILIFLAFIFYAIGQTFYWPTVLGLVAERFPKGGAITLNTVSAMGLLTVGIFGFPFLGAVKDSFDAEAAKKTSPALYETYGGTGKFFGVEYQTVNAAKLKADESLSKEALATVTTEMDKSARKTLRVAAVLPLIMAIGFGLIALWFKARGGYKPIELGSESSH